MKRVPVQFSGTERPVAVASEYRLAGVDWSYYNTVTQLLEYTSNFPEGFAAHFAWQGEGEWRVLNLWRTDALREQFFIEVGIERISQGIQLLGAVANREGATDVEPVQFAVPSFVIGPRARAFADNGDDRDGSAIHALGGDPAALEIDIAGMGSEDYKLLIDRLGYEASVPAELIAHHGMIEDDGIRIFETWSDGEHAHATLDGALMPAIERLGTELGKDFQCVHHDHGLNRIALNPEIVTAFGF